MNYIYIYSRSLSRIRQGFVALSLFILSFLFSLFSFLSPLAWLLRKIGKKQDKLVMNFHYEPQRLLFRDLASLLFMSSDANE